MREMTLRRTQLATPASDKRMMKSAAAEVFHDLEDAVAPDRKSEVREVGEGAVTVDGQMVDEATHRMAQEIVSQAEAVDILWGRTNLSLVYSSGSTSSTRRPSGSRTKAVRAPASG